MTRDALARDRLRKWGIARRWTKYETRLGPLPQKFHADIPEPTSALTLFSEAMQGYFVPPVREVASAWAQSALARVFEEAEAEELATRLRDYGGGSD